jgi:hypothetical protein
LSHDQNGIPTIAAFGYINDEQQRHPDVATELDGLEEISVDESTIVVCAADNG